MNAQIRDELENLQLQFGMRAQLTLDDYAALYGINRKHASEHLRRRNIPYTKEGKSLYISMLDLAAYKAKCKTGVPLLARPVTAEDMKSRRGFARRR